MEKEGPLPAGPGGVWLGDNGIRHYDLSQVLFLMGYLRIHEAQGQDSSSNKIPFSDIRRL